MLVAAANISLEFMAQNNSYLLNVRELTNASVSVCRALTKRRPPSKYEVIFVAGTPLGRAVTIALKIITTESLQQQKRGSANWKQRQTIRTKTFARECGKFGT